VEMASNLHMQLAAGGTLAHDKKPQRSPAAAEVGR